MNGVEYLQIIGGVVLRDSFGVQRSWDGENHEDASGVSRIYETDSNIEDDTFNIYVKF